MNVENIPNTKRVSAEKILTWTFFLVIVAVVIITFYKYFILKDYYIEAQTECDPETEACFVSTCDPATDDTCSKNPDEQTSYYKIIKKKAYLIPLCDPNNENCPKLVCSQGEDCEETLCNESNVPDGKECNDPEVYKENLKSQEESGACSPDDENCTSDENSGDSNSDNTSGDVNSDSGE